MRGAQEPSTQYFPGVWESLSHFTLKGFSEITQFRAKFRDFPFYCIKLREHNQEKNSEIAREHDCLMQRFVNGCDSEFRDKFIYFLLMKFNENNQKTN
jgi:hypothetical protein